MGNSLYSYRCELCQEWCGNERLSECAGAKVYHHGGLGGHIFCIECIKLYMKDKDFNDKNESYRNELGCFDKCKICQYCNLTNKSVKSKPIFKIYSAGKHQNKFMCKSCIFDKSYRRKNKK